MKSRRLLQRLAADMSLSMLWAFGASHPTRSGDNDVATSSLLLNLFEIYPEDYEDEERTNIENSAIYPDFVREFEKQRDFVPTSYEEGVKWLEENDGPQPYISPSFEPEQLLSWARAWIEILSDCEDDIKDAFDLRARGFDWTDETLEDLQSLQHAAERAIKDGLTLHIEIY